MELTEGKELERVATVEDNGEDAMLQPQTTREDTVKAVCSVIQESCFIVVKATDISCAHRLRSKGTDPRLILIFFNSISLRSTVARARQPKQTLKYKKSNIYIDDHLTKINSNLAHKAREAVKNKDAYSTWVCDGQIYIKWYEDYRPSLIHAMSDLN